MSAYRSFPANGADLALHDAGGDGLPVVFQHGLGGDAVQTQEAFPEDPRFRRITLECRGHGNSQASGPFSIAQFADDLSRLIETLDVPIVLGGISMGAAISVRLAVTRPELVRGLVLVRPAWVADDAPANLQAIALAGRLLSVLEPEAARTAFESTPVAQRLVVEGPDNMTSLLGFFDRRPIAEFAALLSSISADGPGVSEADLGKLDIPTVVYSTPTDVVHPIPLARQLSDLIPGSAYVELPAKALDKAAHAQALRREMSGFLSRFL